MNIPEWFSDPRIQNIAPEKLELMKRLAVQIEGKSQKEAMPIMIGAAASAAKQNLQFTPEEFSLLFDIMKTGKSDSEKAQMDEMISRANHMMRERSSRLSH